MAFIDGAIGRAAETLPSPRGAASTPTLPASREAARAATPFDAARAITRGAPDAADLVVIITSLASSSTPRENARRGRAARERGRARRDRHEGVVST